MMHAKSRRGTIVALYAAIVVVTGAACALVLARTLEGYASSARLVHKLQAQAAVEGVSRMVASTGGKDVGTVGVGQCMVTVDVGPHELSRTLTARVSGKTGREVYVGTWTASFLRRGDGSWAVQEVCR